jgi:hypothetical protein
MRYVNGQAFVSSEQFCYLIPIWKTRPGSARAANGYDSEYEFTPSNATRSMFASNTCFGNLSAFWPVNVTSFFDTTPIEIISDRFSMFSLCVIHKEGLCPSSGDINRLMMMMMMMFVMFRTLPLSSPSNKNLPKKYWYHQRKNLYGDRDDRHMYCFTLSRLYKTVKIL